MVMAIQIKFNYLKKNMLQLNTDRIHFYLQDEHLVNVQPATTEC